MPSNTSRCLCELGAAVGDTDARLRENRFPLYILCSCAFSGSKEGGAGEVVGNAPLRVAPQGELIDLRGFAGGHGLPELVKLAGQVLCHLACIPAGLVIVGPAYRLLSATPRLSSEFTHRHVHSATKARAFSDQGTCIQRPARAFSDPRHVHSATQGTCIQRPLAQKKQLIAIVFQMVRSFPESA